MYCCSSVQFGIDVRDSRESDLHEDYSQNEEVSYRIPEIAIVPSKIVMKSPVSEFDELCRGNSWAVALANGLFEVIFQISVNVSKI